MHLHLGCALPVGRTPWSNVRHHQGSSFEPVLVRAPCVRNTYHLIMPIAANLCSINKKNHATSYIKVEGMTNEIKSKPTSHNEAEAVTLFLQTDVDCLGDNT